MDDVLGNLYAKNSAQNSANEEENFPFRTMCSGQENLQECFIVKLDKRLRKGVEIGLDRPMSMRHFVLQIGKIFNKLGTLNL